MNGRFEIEFDFSGRTEAAEDVPPDGFPILRGGVAGGDEIAKFGGGDEDVALFEEDGGGFRGEAEDGGVVAGDSGDDEERVLCGREFNGDVVAIVGGDDAHLREIAAEGI